MSTNNIYQVLNEDDLEEIMNDYKQNLIITMYSSTSCGPCKMIKPTFVNISKDNPDCFFIYVNVEEFKEKKFTYTRNITAYPTFIFYLNNTEIGIVIGAQKEALVNTLQQIKNKIQEIVNSVEEEELEELDQLNIQKIAMLKKLQALVMSGIQLTQGYNLNNSLEEMIAEFNFHTNVNNSFNNINNQHNNYKQHTIHNPDQIQEQETILFQNEHILEHNTQEQLQNEQSQETNINDIQAQINYLQNQIIKEQETATQVTQVTQVDDEELAKKSEKLKKLKELEKYKYKLQMDEICRLQRLQNFQKMKQEKEKLNKN